MKMLLTTAQTLPLWISKSGQPPPPLCGAIPAESSHVTDPEALFSKDATVMALYPQTTCFYKAIINQQPKSAQDEYQVLFEDSSYAEGFSPPLMVAQRYVIAIKEKKK